MTDFRWQEGQAGRIEASGTSLEAACHGPPPAGATTLVLLHEGLGCVALWRDFPSRLAEATGHGVFVYSRAGYGRSDPVSLPRPLDYMTREAIDVLPEVLDAAGVERAILLGHSDGATIAAIHTGQVRDPRVKGLVLIAPHFFTEPGGLASIAQARAAYASTDLRARLARYHDDPDIAFNGWCDAWLDPGFKDWDVRDVLETIPVPVLAIQGESDQYGTQAQVEVISALCPSPVRVEMLKACGHSPHLEAAEATLDMIVAFAHDVMKA